MTEGEEVEDREEEGRKGERRRGGGGEGKKMKRRGNEEVDERRGCTGELLHLMACNVADFDGLLARATEQKSRKQQRQQ